MCERNGMRLRPLLGVDVVHRQVCRHRTAHDRGAFLLHVAHDRARDGAAHVGAAGAALATIWRKSEEMRPLEKGPEARLRHTGGVSGASHPSWACVLPIHIQWPRCRQVRNDGVLSLT